MYPTHAKAIGINMRLQFSKKYNFKLSLIKADGIDLKSSTELVDVEMMSL